MHKYLIVLLLLIAIPAHAVMRGHGQVEVRTGTGAHMNISTGGTVTVATAGTYQKVAGGTIAYTGAHLEHFNEDTDGRLVYVGLPTKSFLVTVSGSVESGEVAQEVNLRIAKTGTSIVGSDIQQTFTAINTHEVYSTNYMVDLNTNDYIEIYVTSDTNGDDVIFNAMSVCVVQID